MARAVEDSRSPSLRRKSSKSLPTWRFAFFRSHLNSSYGCPAWRTSPARRAVGFRYAASTKIRPGKDEAFFGARTRISISLPSAVRNVMSRSIEKSSSL